MKRILLCLTLFLPLISFSQNVVFWTEDFGTGCNAGQQANNYFSINNGIWTVVSTGTNADGANNWFVSAAENGNAVGQCGSGCGTDRTLHLGADGSFAGTDLGASYYEGSDAVCDILPCGATDKRVDSPPISCSGIGNVEISFVYLEGGNAIDNATLWYFDGTTWSMLIDLPKTALTCSPQGIWSNFTMPLPASANNNLNVKIGFRWVNNDDLDATDPSFAVDDIALNGDFGVDLIPPVVICPPDLTVFTEDFCAQVDDYSADLFVMDDVDPFPQVVQSPETGTPLVPGVYVITYTATDTFGNSAECSFNLTVIDDDTPIFNCPANIVAAAPSGQTSTFVNIPVPAVFENCGSYLLINDFNGAESASGVYPLGVTTVVYTATDDAGNSSDCSFNVTVDPSNQDCCLGDYNCDGFISVADLLIIIGDFGCTAGCFADLDGNDIITVADMQIFTGLYGTTCP